MDNVAHRLAEERPRQAASRAQRLVRALFRPIDGAGLAAFRILFGLLLCAGAVRFLTSGWIPAFYGEPTFWFHYWGFDFIRPPSLGAIYFLYGALAVLALFIALGLFYRLSAILFFLGFTYAQLLDVTNYLNHYYLVSLLALVFAFTPLHRMWSVDARLSPSIRSQTVPAWALYLLRFQVAVVYVFAGLAKLSRDWLVYAQPLNLWLTARTETPVVGPWLDDLWVAYALSWAAFLFDTTIVAFLLCRRTRPYGYAVVVLFHAFTRLFFNIGMFPFIMVTAAAVFFSPSWPRRLAPYCGRLARRLWPPDARPARPFSLPPPPRHRAPAPGESPPHRPGATLGRTAGLAVAAIYCLVQIAIPLRHVAYPSNVLWSEEGMRFSWKVMVREKHGSVTYFVRLPQSGKELQVYPARYLDARQEREMAGQPDLILQLAHHIAADFRARGYGEVEVRAEALVSLNGRPARPMIDRQRNLAKVSFRLSPADWILEDPDDPPMQLRRLASARQGK